MNQKRILYEDQDIIVCHKPAGIATQTSRVGQADMVSEIANHLGGSDRGRVRHMPYVGVVHRLDQPVEGILVLAKNKDAAARLSRQITGNETEKYYYAIVCGRDYEKEGRLEDYLLKDGSTNMSAVVPPEVRGAKRAVLQYEILAEHNVVPDAGGAGRERTEEDIKEASSGYRIALARIRLCTGRHHQIRVQMSHAGMSLLGDHKYADVETVKISEKMQAEKIALCAYRLNLRHPRTGESLQFVIRPEGSSFQIEEFMPYYESGEKILGLTSV